MKLDVFSYSNKGGRSANEDSIGSCVYGGDGVFVLADGLGGHLHGKAASELAVDALLEGVKATSIQDSQSLNEAILSANSAILEKQKQPEYRNMKTTCVVLHISCEQAVWGHVGDSRLYYYSGGELESVTRDHSVTYKKYLSGDITYDNIRTDEDRSSLLGVLGNQDKCVPELSPIRTLAKGDAFLLCSDGFWEYVWDEEIQIDLIKSETAREWGNYLLLRYVQRMLPSSDNISIITVFVGEEDSCQ